MTTYFSSNSWISCFTRSQHFGGKYTDRKVERRCSQKSEKNIEIASFTLHNEKIRNLRTIQNFTLLRTIQKETLELMHQQTNKQNKLPDTRNLRSSWTNIHYEKQFAGKCREKCDTRQRSPDPHQPNDCQHSNAMRAHLHYLGHLDDELCYRLPTTLSKVGHSYDSSRGIFFLFRFVESLHDASHRSTEPPSFAAYSQL